MFLLCGLSNAKEISASKFQASMYNLSGLHAANAAANYKEKPENKLNKITK